MRALLEARELVVPDSKFERLFLRLLLDAGLERPVLQHPIKDGGRLVGIVDFAYPKERIAIETDGYASHSGRAAWAYELARGNDLALLDWVVLHFTWRDLTQRPRSVVSKIDRAMKQRRESQH